MLPPRSGNEFDIICNDDHKLSIGENNCADSPDEGKPPNDKEENNIDETEGLIVRGNDGDGEGGGNENEDNGSDNFENEEDLISIEEAIGRLCMGPFQYNILVASGLCFASDAMQVIMLSFLTLVLKAEWNLSNSMTESLTSCLFAGAMVGTLIIGPAADVVGRRPMFLLSASIISIFGLATSLANSYWVVFFCLFWVGFGIGGLIVPFDLFAEVLPPEKRGTILLAIEYFWSLGSLYVVVLAYLALHGATRANTTENDGEEISGGRHWRAFVALCTLPCIISLVIGYLYVPESALWLVERGRYEEALTVLRNAAKDNGHDPYEIFPLTMRLRRIEWRKKASVADLFTPRWRKITVPLWGTWGGFAFGYYGTILAITKVFQTQHQNEDSNNDQMHTDSYDFDYGAIFISTAAEFVGTTLVILLVDRIGRIPAQVGCYGMAGVSVCLLCTLSAWKYNYFILVLLGFSARVFEMGATCTSWVSTAEILTTEVRSTGHGTANAVARIGAFLCPFLVESDKPLAQIGIIMLFVHLFTAMCASKLPETKGRDIGAAVDELGGEEHITDGTDPDDCPEVEASNFHHG